MALVTFRGREEQPRIAVWDISADAELWSAEQAGSSVTGIAFSVDGRMLATASWAEPIYLRDAQTGAIQQTLRSPGHRAYSVAFSPDGKFLATRGTQPFTTVRLWDLSDRELNAMIGHTGNALHVLAFSPGGCQLTSVGGLFDGASSAESGERSTSGIWTKYSRLAELPNEARFQSSVKSAVRRGAAERPAGG